MPYPSLDQYQSAVQDPARAFASQVLRQGQVDRDDLGIPNAFGGGFAYTYALKSGGREFAVRCFKAENARRQQRYDAISRFMRVTHRQYWVPFEYQPTGIRVVGAAYPIVKMDWVKGHSLLDFISKHRRDSAKIRLLRDQIVELAADLELSGCAHGDLQGSNVLVRADGSVVLIDYDGLYVPGMPRGQGDELGIAHFQHPSRTEALFGPEMDRFSLAIIWLSLEALVHRPELYERYGAGSNIVFSANDFVNWGGSPLVRELLRVDGLSRYVERAGRLCEISPHQLPSLADFLDPAKPIVGARAAPPTSPAVAGLVLDATEYDKIRRHIGERIEVRGKITDITELYSARERRQYVLISFTQKWRGPLFRVAIWDGLLPKMRERPSNRWVGRYVTVSGLLQPEFQYVSRGGKSYPRLSISLQEESQLRFIAPPNAATPPIGRVPPAVSPQPVPSTSSGRGRSNQEILGKLKRSHQSRAAPQAGASSRSAHPPMPQASGAPPLAAPSTGSNCFVATAAYGNPDHENVVRLRVFRDQILRRSTAGRAFIALYWWIGPHAARVVKESRLLALISRLVIRTVIRFLPLRDATR